MFYYKSTIFGVIAFILSTTAAVCIILMYWQFTRDLNVLYRAILFDFTYTVQKFGACSS